MTPSVSSAFSNYWHRVRDLKPQLTTDVRIEREVHRGEAWYSLFGPRQRPIRMNASAYAFVGRLEGTRTVQEIWDALGADDPDGAPRQDEVIRILSDLNQRRLLQAEPGIDFDALFSGGPNASRKTRRSWNPVAIRLVLGNPRRLLDALEPLAQRLFRLPMLALWAVFVAYGGLLAAAQWDALYAHAAKWMTTPYYALLALCVYPVIKALHELAHGMALKRWHCEVDAAGVTLFLLIPMPFVDASGSAALRKSSQRIAVSAAGIMAELLIASGALAFWLNAEPGTARDIAFVAAFTASVSTLLVNANPLLRFDGYYILVDALDLPNLASRSARYWGELLQRRVLRIPVASAVVPARGERVWLLAYAPLSWTYRAALCAALTVWVGSFSFVVGAVVGAIFAVTLLMPIVRGLGRALRATAPGSGARARTAAAMGAGCVALVLFLTAVPMPFGANVPGVVWLPENARVRAGTEGFVLAIVARDGARVAEGDVLLVLENARIAGERAQLAARAAALEAELFSAARQDAAGSANIFAELERLKAELARAEERVAGLTVRAGCDGTLVMPQQNDIAGAFARQGAMLGHIVPEGSPVVRVAVPQDDAALIGTSSRHVRARLASALADEVPGDLERDARGAVSVLPSAALSTRHGGSIVTEADDKSGLKVLAPVVLMDVRLPDRNHERFGERAWVRFEYERTPLAGQWLRRARQVFLKHFQPAA